MSIPRGKYAGEPYVPVLDEAEHVITCALCGGKIDCRDLGHVFDHEGPLPHPGQDRVQ